MRSARVVVAAAIALSTLAIGNPASAAPGDPASGWGSKGVNGYEGISNYGEVETLSNGSIITAFKNDEGSVDEDFVYVNRYAGTGGLIWSKSIQINDDSVDFVDLDVRGNTAFVTVNQQSNLGAMIEVRKYTPAGLDTTWADGGVMSFGAGSALPDAVATATAPDGGLFIVAGKTLYKIDDDGDPENFFSGDGKAPLPLKNRTVEEIAVDPAGRIAIVGNQSGEPHKGFLIRLKPNGSLVKGFGTNGVVGLKNPKSTHTALWSVVWTADSKLVVGGIRWESDEPAKDRLTSGRVIASSGAMDTTYGGNGWASFRFGSSSFRNGSAVVQPNGKVIVCGGTGRTWAIARFRTDGTLDPGFGDKGVLKVLVGDESTATAWDVAVDASHKRLAVAGTETDDEFDRWFAVGAFTLS